MHGNVYAGSFYEKKITTQARYSQRLLRNITAATQLTLLIKWRSVHKRLCSLIHASMIRLYNCL